MVALLALDLGQLRWLLAFLLVNEAAATLDFPTGHRVLAGSQYQLSQGRSESTTSTQQHRINNFKWTAILRGQCKSPGPLQIKVLGQ